MRIFNGLIVPKNLKGTLWDFLTFVVVEYQKKLKGGPFGVIEKFSKKVSQSRKGGFSAEKVRTFCFGILVKKNSAYAWVGFEHEPSGLKSKHLTTRPRTPELCDLRAETRELSRGKSTRTLP